MFIWTPSHFVPATSITILLATCATTGNKKKCNEYMWWKIIDVLLKSISLTFLLSIVYWSDGKKKHLKKQKSTLENTQTIQIYETRQLRKPPTNSSPGWVQVLLRSGANMSLMLAYQTTAPKSRSDGCWVATKIARVFCWDVKYSWILKYGTHKMEIWKIDFSVQSGDFLVLCWFSGCKGVQMKGLEWYHI